MGAGNRILVVDDDEDTIRILTEVFSNGEYEVATAGNGEEALERVESFSPDLILLDVMMPKMSGFEVCKRLRADPKHQGIVVLFLSAKAELDARVQGIEWGANDYVVKPFDVSEILTRVRRHLSVKAQFEEKNSVEQLAALGRMTLLLRHEINNPLTVIYGQCQLLLQSSRLSDEVRDKVKLINEMTQRITQIMHQLDRVKEEEIPSPKRPHDPSKRSSRP